MFVEFGMSFEGPESSRYKRVSLNTWDSFEKARLSVYNESNLAIIAGISTNKRAGAN